MVDFRSRRHTSLLLGAIVCVAQAAAGQPKPKPAPPAPAPLPAPAPGELSQQGELQRVITLYDAGRFAECAREFDTLIGREPKKIDQPELLEKARVYYAACLIASNKQTQAEDQMRTAIRANPRMQTPDVLVFPEPVVKTFIRVQTEMIEEIQRAQAEQLKKDQEAALKASERAAKERARIEALERLAEREYVVVENRRWLAAVPFGVGQFQNREPVLGWIFLTSEVLLAGTAITALVVELNLNAKADDDPPPDPAELNARLDAWHQVMVASTWGFLTVATVGILQAQIAYVPEFRERRFKPLPPELRKPVEPAPAAWIRPTAVPLRGGVSLGVVGRF